MFDSGAMPVLTRMIQFTQARHRVLTDNIANLSTPYYEGRDLDPVSFQEALREATDRRRKSGDPMTSPLRIEDTDELKFTPGGIEAKPRQAHQGILYHDRNDRDLERVMQSLAENTMAHNVAIELLRSEYGTLSTAIRGRV
jgi:flagellar basal-body rod protein FlgB